jgi:hypothetical protein
MRCSLLIPALVLATSFFCNAETAFTAAAAPRTGALKIIREGEPYLGFEYYDWGDGWSGVERKQESVEGDREVHFTFNNKLQKTNAAFKVEGSWKQPAPDTFRFEAVLTPEATSPIRLAQFAVVPGSTFQGQEATVVSADGNRTVAKVPFGIGTLGSSVKELSFKDSYGVSATLVFDAPVQIATDNQARMVLVADNMEAGKTYPLAFTLKLPAAANFFPGPNSVPPSTQGWYEFKGESPIPAESEWNMSAWLEKPAGKHGRIASKDNQLVYNGKPLKLWGLNVSYANCAPEKALADRRADFYAALGVNAVRLHKYADGKGWAGIQGQDSAADLDPIMLDRMDYFVAALKERGIYVKLSPVFLIKPGPADKERVPFLDEFGPMDGRVNPKHGSLYLSTELQDLLIEQMTKVLTHENPYTKLTYAADPTVAYFELYNEDSALFGGITGVMAKSPTLRARAGKLFVDWLKKKYISEQEFLAAWGKGALNNGILSNQGLPLDESWAEDRIYPAGNPWFFDPDNLDTSLKPVKRRLLDTMAFLYDLQNQVYARMAKAVRDTGYQGEMIASNWQAGRAMSHFYNLSSDTMIGTVDRHNYFGSGSGFYFSSSSMSSTPGSGSLSASLQQVYNRPFMLSEWIHVYPNEWGVEGPAIIGAYGIGLQGWDVSFPFQNGDEGTFARGVGFQEWDVVAPNFLGIFPAVSRQVLRGDVKESDVVHTRNVNIASLDEEKVGFDDKVTQQRDVKTFDSDVFPARALAAAKGVVRFTDNFEPTPAFDLTPYEKDGVITASTGQLRWVTGKTPHDGHIEINTPGTQAVVGFANGVTAKLEDATITLASRFGAIYLSAQSPDGTIANDRGVLITAISRARNADAVIAEDSFLFNKGIRPGFKPTGPAMMEPVLADIAFHRSGTPTVHILDHNGVKTGKTVPVENGMVRIDTGRDQTPYYLVTW